VDASFDHITSTDHALALLAQFTEVLRRDALQQQLRCKWVVIFQHYARDLEAVQATYEAHKHKPPLPRNAPPIVRGAWEGRSPCLLACQLPFPLLPPLQRWSRLHTPKLRPNNHQAGNMLWARQLLRRIEGPMQRFARIRALMGSRESKRVIRLYNQVAKTLLEFQMLWHAAWLKVWLGWGSGWAWLCWGVWGFVRRRT